MIDKFQLLENKIIIHYEEDLSPIKQDDIAVIDGKVYELFADSIPFTEDRIFMFDVKEKNKSMKMLENFLSWLQQKKFTRSDTIWAFGGGITTDFSGFAASIYKRGCKLHFVPTTVLGMIDASIGGKTALNFGNQKNFIGSFYPADEIFIQTKWLEKLPEEELQNGMVELCKIALIHPSNVYNEMMQNSRISLNLIQFAIREKMKICSTDPHDYNQRRLLNLGHTFGHILESIYNYRISHGESVYWGIKSALLMSRKMRYITPDKEKKINHILSILKIKPFWQRLDLTKIEEFDPQLFFQDKKADSHVNLILFKNFQSCFVYPTQKVHLLKKAMLEVFHEEL